jgi:phosphoribosylamine--glycine ligase
MRFVVVGSGGREHAIIRKLSEDIDGCDSLCNIGTKINVGIKRVCPQLLVPTLCSSVSLLDSDDVVIIGPENPLADGIVDNIRSMNIKCIGPTQLQAKFESSKSYCRQQLANSELAKYQPDFTIVDGAHASNISNFIQKHGLVVIKRDGLHGGKGVTVPDTLEEQRKLINKLIIDEEKFLLEERLVGKEFSLISLCDGKHVLHFPPVRDFKRLNDGDTGPNTGGMGCTSDCQFLDQEAIELANSINQTALSIIAQSSGQPYCGVLFGGFMLTSDGVKLIEYNVRFGDPEVIVLLSLLKSNFAALLKSLISGQLDLEEAIFDTQTIHRCLYLVPVGYPNNPQRGRVVIHNDNNIIYGDVVRDDDDGNDDGHGNGELYSNKSRTLAIINPPPDIAEVVTGDLIYRRDI